MNSNLIEFPRDAAPKRARRAPSERLPVGMNRLRLLVALGCEDAREAFVKRARALGFGEEQDDNARELWELLREIEPLTTS